MNINQQETRALLEQKTGIEKKDFELARQEIQRDKIFLIGFDKLKRENNYLKNQLNKKEIQIDNLKLKLKQQTNKKFKEKFKQLTESRNYVNCATTKDLWRILSYLDSNGRTSLNDLTLDCGLNSRRKQRDNAISFLSKLNIIKVQNGSTIFLER